MRTTQAFLRKKILRAFEDSDLAERKMNWARPEDSALASTPFITSLICQGKVAVNYVYNTLLTIINRSFVSGKHLVMLDPHARYLPGETQSCGKRYVQSIRFILPQAYILLIDGITWSALK